MELGTIVYGPHVGYRSCNHYMWCACEDCGKERWVQVTHKEPKHKLCQVCCGRRVFGRAKKEKHGRWNGGKWISQGYTMVKLYPDNPFYPMATRPNDYVLEHRLVMARHMGRCLKSWEIVHHVNHVRTDNTIENLQILESHNHNQVTIMEFKINSLEKRVTLLEAENALLKEQYEQATSNY